jgi:hypothetical protein
MNRQLCMVRWLFPEFIIFAFVAGQCAVYAEDIVQRQSVTSIVENLRLTVQYPEQPVAWSSAVVSVMVKYSATNYLQVLDWTYANRFGTRVWLLASNQTPVNLLDFPSSPIITPYSSYSPLNGDRYHFACVLTTGQEIRVDHILCQDYESPGVGSYSIIATFDSNIGFSTNFIPEVRCFDHGVHPPSEDPPSTNCQPNAHLEIRGIPITIAPASSEH